MLIREQGSLLQHVLAAAGLTACTELEIRDGQVFVDGVRHVFVARPVGTDAHPAPPAQPPVARKAVAKKVAARKASATKV